MQRNCLSSPSRLDCLRSHPPTFTRKCTVMLDSSPPPAHRTRSPDREWELFMAETGAAIGITTTTTTVSSLSVASHSLALGTPLLTLMDTATIPTADTTPTPLTTVVATTVA